MNLKCISTLITIYAPGMGCYLSNVSYEITKGNVFPMSTNNRPGYYEINGSEFPNYLFELTDEPITVIEKDNRDIQKERIAEREEQIRQESIRDNMDLYYSPEKYYARQRQKEKFIRGLSEVFVQGISYG